ncbi:MAG: bifunctional 5,10-methylenetetrahydrofolate dehydrogenase/5,10-methenyltetrahydrofolate cyclohydrolase [Hyphomonadaceae bacterium]|nr:bifunctional 5,10-methylenetetrahydrofolate dehydrogenase/5,10-methenyltetrahydrofolate cyclohydrolase [Hyphomonadaceae bacterium]
MTATILEGHALADRMLAETRAKADAVAAAIGRRPRLVILLLREDPGALAYAERQAEFAARAGIVAELRRVKADEDALALVAALNADAAIDGILPLFPLPPHIDPLALAQAIAPAKDVDGLNPFNAGRLAVGLDALAPCTPQAAIMLAASVVGELRGLDVTVVGASIGVGRPLAQMLLQREATVTIAHVATRDLAKACRGADLLFVAVGKPGLIRAEHVKAGAVVIDIGINVLDDGAGGKRIVGDVDVASVEQVASAISAAPDGVGPLTTAHLMANVVRAAQRR